MRHRCPIASLARSSSEHVGLCAWSARRREWLRETCQVLSGAGPLTWVIVTEEVGARRSGEAAHLSRDRCESCACNRGRVSLSRAERRFRPSTQRSSRRVPQLVGLVVHPGEEGLPRAGAETDIGCSHQQRRRCLLSVTSRISRNRWPTRILAPTWPPSKSPGFGNQPEEICAFLRRQLARSIGGRCGGEAHRCDPRTPRR
jgi:hypothetical protein